MATEISNHKGPGRPTAMEQVEIVKKIKPYFEMGVSAEFTSKQPGMPHENTIKSYFRKWKEQYLKTEAPDIEERQRESKSQFMAVYDKIIFNISAQLNEIIGLKLELRRKYEQKIEVMKRNGKPEEELPVFKPDPFLENKFTSLNKFLAEIISGKMAVKSAPYVHERTYDYALKKLQEKQKQVIR